MVRTVKEKYLPLLKDPIFVRSLFVSIIFLIFSMVVNFFAGTFATIDASNPVSDVILSNIPVFDVDSIFVYGAYLFVILVAIVCSIYPQRIPFTLKAASLFVIIRSIFINLTHIAPFPTQIVIDPLSFMSKFTFGGDLFFSGHAGLPFLMALIFWDNKRFRILFIVISVLLGAITLMGHLHYSIDVFAAFFITYSIYHLSAMWFKKDLEMNRVIR